MNPYGAAKAYAHQMVGVYRARGLHAVGAILYNHESPRRPTAFVTRKITATVAAIARGRADQLPLGNLDARRDWGWAPDYVDAMVRAARADLARDYVVATGESHTVRDFVAAAFAHAGVDDWAPLSGSTPTSCGPQEPRSWSATRPGPAGSWAGRRPWASRSSSAGWSTPTWPGWTPGPPVTRSAATRRCRLVVASGTWSARMAP